FNPRTAWLACFVLVGAIAAVYAPVLHADWVGLDDIAYVAGNPGIRDGLTLAGLRHVLVEPYAGLWMPLTFVSHALDVTLFGFDPTGPLVVNVALHAVSAALLLWWLARTTHALGPSIAVAFLFALHPLRVESVAWIAERKDVLSMLLALVTLHAW